MRFYWHLRSTVEDKKRQLRTKWGSIDVYVRQLRTKREGYINRWLRQRDGWGRNEVLLMLMLDSWEQKETVEDKMRFYWRLR